MSIKLELNRQIYGIYKIHKIKLYFLQISICIAWILEKCSHTVEFLGYSILRPKITTNSRGYYSESAIIIEACFV